MLFTDLCSSQDSVVNGVWQILICGSVDLDISTKLTVPTLVIWKIKNFNVNEMSPWFEGNLYIFPRDMHTCTSFRWLIYRHTFCAEHQNDNKIYWKTKKNRAHSPLWLTSRGKLSRLKHILKRTDCFLRIHYTYSMHTCMHTGARLATLPLLVACYIFLFCVCAVLFTITYTYPCIVHF